MGRSSSRLNYQPAKIGGHNYSGSGDIMFLVCPVILQDHVIKVSCDFTGKKPSR